MKKNILFILLCFVFTQAQGQLALKHGYSSTAAGIGKIYPNFKSEVNTDPWTNYVVRNGIFEFQFAQGNFTYGEVGDEGYQSDKGSLLNIGVIVPLHHLTIIQRNNYWRGIHVTPLIGVHYTTHSMGRFAGIAAGQSGLNVAPTLSVQFPLGMIDLKLNNGFYFGSSKTREVMKRYRGSRYMFTPAITIQLDGMFERLGGSVVESGEFSTTWRQLESEEVEYDDSNTSYRVKTTRRKYSYRTAAGKSGRKIQRAFWYLSGTFNKSRSAFLPGYSDEERDVRYIPDGTGLGLSVGGRYKNFMADVGVERNSGFYALRDPEFIKELEAYESSYPLIEGEFSALEIRGKIGFDFVSAVGNIVAARQTRRLKNLDMHWVKFMRFHFGLSGGLGLPGKTKMRTPNGDQLLDNFFADNPDVERNELTDITKNNSAWTIGLFMNWEIGPISVAWDWHGHHEFGWRSSVGLRYMIPLNNLTRL